MKNYLTGLLVALSLATVAHGSAYAAYPKPHRCTMSSATEVSNFCGCFIEQSVVGCKYATNGAFYCTEKFISSQYNSLQNDMLHLSQFCRKYKDSFPDDPEYNEEVCAQSLQAYKQSCS